MALSRSVEDRRMKEIHLFIPTDDFELPTKQSKNAIRPCYLDIKSGFINFTDDASAGNHGLENCTIATTLQKVDRRLVHFRLVRIADISFLHHSSLRLIHEAISLSST